MISGYVVLHWYFQCKTEFAKVQINHLPFITNHYLAVAELTKSKLYTFDQQQEDAFEAMSEAW